MKSKLKRIIVQFLPIVIIVGFSLGIIIFLVLFFVLPFFLPFNRQQEEIISIINTIGLSIVGITALASCVLLIFIFTVPLNDKELKYLRSYFR